MRNIAVTLSFLALAGCASAPEIPRAVKDEADKPLTCEGKDQCDLYWQRALFYVNAHSSFKIQTATDNLIQTYSPSGGSPLVGYNISREPLANGSARLWVKVYCDNMFGCSPNLWEEVANFKRYVSSGNS